MDHPIQAREQTMEFATWSQSMNRMDVPGVDDHDPFSALGGVVYDPTAEFE